MRVQTVKIEYNPGDKFTLWPISDPHLGAIDSNEEALRKHISAIASDPYARIIFMGDIGDLIDPRDVRRFAPGMLDRRYVEALFSEGGIHTEVVNHATELFSPVREKILTWLSGNHEYSVRLKTDRELGSEITSRLEVPYLGYGGFLKIQWVRKSKRDVEAVTVLDLHHGWQAGRRKGAKINQMELDLAATDADIVLRGHSHDKTSDTFDAFRVTGGTVRDWPRVVAHCGSYKVGRVTNELVLHDTWESRRGFPNKMVSRLGPPRIIMKPQTSSGSRDKTLPMVEFEVVN